MREKKINWKRFGKEYGKYTRARTDGEMYELYNDIIGQWEVVEENTQLWDWAVAELR